MSPLNATPEFVNVYALSSQLTASQTLDLFFLALIMGVVGALLVEQRMLQRVLSVRSTQTFARNLTPARGWSGRARLW